MVTEHKFNCKEDICARKTQGTTNGYNTASYAWREEDVSTTAGYYGLNCAYTLAPRLEVWCMTGGAQETAHPCLRCG
jgi:hypothetical protein